MKRVIVPIVLGLVLAAIATVVLMNSHIDIFPCEKREMLLRGHGAWTSGMCDYLATHDYGGEPDARLTGAGWAVFVLVGLLVPFGIGAGVGALVTRRK